MEEGNVQAITPEQLAALTEGGANVEGGGEEVYYTYVNSEEEAASLIQGSQQVIHEAADAQTGENVPTEGQEVLVYDESTGEYQKCYYVPQGTDVATEDTIGVDTADTEAAEQEYVAAEETADGQSFIVKDGENQQIDLKELLENGSLSAEDYTAITGQEVIQQEIVEDQQQPQVEAGDELVQVYVPDDQELNLEQILALANQQQAAINDENNLPQEHQQIPQQQQLSAKQQIYVQRPATGQKIVTQSSSALESNCQTELQTCPVCRTHCLPKAYPGHFKAKHSDIRLGCPKCTQTYHSPELLNVHYRHFHLANEKHSGDENEKDPNFLQKKQDGRITLKNVRLLMKCKACDLMVRDISAHMADSHAPLEPFSAAATALFPSSKQHSPAAISHKELMKKKRDWEKEYQELIDISCHVCGKSYASQKEFSNHRRRVGYCRPPVTPPSPPPEKKRRRVGILRRN